MKNHNAGHNPFLPRHPFPMQTHETFERMYRVNLAGEKGAIAIYEGQLKALKNHPRKHLITDMMDHEKEHVALFTQEAGKRHVRPSILAFLWYHIGYTAGYAAGKMGFSAAMAQTQAVETVIESHYNAQLAQLDPSDPLYACVARCKEDEVHHKEQGDKESEAGFAMDAWRAFNRLGTRLAIALAKRF